MPTTIARLVDLGAPIAAGRTAEVFAFGEGRVLKLLRPGFPVEMGEREARLAERVGAVYAGAPKCLGSAAVEGRFGLIYERVKGPSMDDEIRRHPWALDRQARTLASLHVAMHESSGVGLPDQLPALRAAIERASPLLQAAARDTVARRLDRLSTGTSICHGDLHPGNVILGSDRAVVIDWENARSGNPAGDVARAIYLIRDTPIDVSPVFARFAAAIRRRFTDSYLARYRQLRPLVPEELTAWRLPILAARLAEGIQEERRSLLARIDQELSVAD